jgi:hypothetical protein
MAAENTGNRPRSPGKHHGARVAKSFLTDAKGKRTAAVIDLRKHKDLWEDIEDVLVSQSRRHDERIPFEKVKADLIKSGKLRG